MVFKHQRFHEELPEIEIEFPPHATSNMPFPTHWLPPAASMPAT